MSQLSQSIQKYKHFEGAHWPGLRQTELIQLPYLSVSVQAEVRSKPTLEDEAPDISWRADSTRY